MLEPVVAKILERGVPVVCTDSCSYLDIIRDPTRETARAHEHRDALAIIEMAEHAEVIVVRASQVQLELSAHLEETTLQSKRKLEKWRENVHQINEIIGVYGGVAQIDLSHADGHVDRALACYHRLNTISFELPEEQAIASRAKARVNAARTPARKGKDSFKDCVVIEAYLDLAERLRRSGFNSKILFVSSNKNDYGEERGATVKSDLAEEFRRLDIQYAVNWGSARHLLQT